MKKINISNEIKELHKDYFIQKIKPELEKEVINDDNCNDLIHSVTSSDLIELGINNLSIVDFERYFKKYYKRFFKFLSKQKNSIRIAIGNMDELLKLDKLLKKKHKFIYSYLFPKEENWGNTHSLKFRKFLLDIFGYDEFIKVDLFEEIKSQASYNLYQEKRRYDGSPSYLEIKRIMKMIFPNSKKIIDDNFPDTRSSMTVSNFKKIYKQINCLNITLLNYKAATTSLNLSWSAYHFILMINLRTCPYCNRQYITPVLSDSGRVRADLDHFLPKSRFPIFSLSLYNLIPVCSNCNSSLKGDKFGSFNDIHPYNTSIADLFKFKIDIINTSITLEIDSSLEPDTKSTVTKHLENFKLETLYNYHRNQVDELVKKRLAYPDERIIRIYNKNQEYFRSIEELKQVIIGFINDESKINDEPFLKYRRDIAKQLGFVDEPSSILIEQLKKINFSN